MRRLVNSSVLQSWK